MIQRVKAAAEAKRDPNFVLIARSDARAVEGLDKAIDRMKAYVDAGADMIFPEAMKSEKEFEAVRAALDVPILANMTEQKGAGSAGFQCGDLSGDHLASRHGRGGGWA